MPTPATDVLDSIRSPSQNSCKKKKKKKEIKPIHIRKEEVKLPLLAGDMVLDAETPREPTKKLLELMNSVMLQDTKYQIKISYISTCHIYL